jgi:hypothetical protein
MFWRQKILDLFDGKPPTGGRVPIEVLDDMIAEAEAPDDGLIAAG